MPVLVSIGDFIFNRTNFNIANYYEGYLYMSLLGTGTFLLMAALTLPAIIKEKIYLTDQKELIFQAAFKKPQTMQISEIALINRGWKQVGNGKVQVVNIYSQTQIITFELKKYTLEDIESLIARLKVSNSKIDNQFTAQTGFKDEIKKYFR